MALGETNRVHSHNRRAVGVFRTRRVAEQALYALRDSGFPMDRVSVITQDSIREDEIAGADVKDSVSESRAAQHVDNKAEEGASVGIATGGALGGLTGLLVGLGTLAIPGIGPIMLAGATATAIATTLAGTAIGAVTGGLLGSLIGLGVPEEQAKVYNERIGRGEYLVIVDGSEAEITTAHRILHHHGIEEYGVYDAPGVASAHLDRDITPTHHEHHDRDLVNRNQHAMGVYSNPRDAELAISDLRSAGFPLSQISLVSRNLERRQPFAGVDLRDRFDAMRYGVPVERARTYEDRLGRGEYLVIVTGTRDEVHQAEPILNRHHIQHWQVFDHTAIPSTRDVDTSRPVEASRPLEASRPVEGVHPTTSRVVSEPTNIARPGIPIAPNPHSEKIGTYKRGFGVFDHRRDVVVAMRELRDSGFPMERVSIIGKDPNETPRIPGVGTDSRADLDPNPRHTTGNKADEGAKTGAATGAALGGLGGLLVGLGALAIPGVGPLIVGGAAATALATALSGGAIGAAAGGLTGGLVGLGIPENRAQAYSDRIDRGDYVVIVDGTENELRQAETILKHHHIEHWDTFNASEAINASYPNTYNQRSNTINERDRTTRF